MVSAAIFAAVVWLTVEIYGCFRQLRRVTMREHEDLGECEGE